MEENNKRNRMQKLDDQTMGLKMAEQAKLDELRQLEQQRNKRMEYSEQLRTDVVKRTKMRELE